MKLIERYIEINPDACFDNTPVARIIRSRAYEEIDVNLYIEVKAEFQFLQRRIEFLIECIDEANKKLEYQKRSKQK